MEEEGGAPQVEGSYLTVRGIPRLSSGTPLVVDVCWEVGDNPQGLGNILQEGGTFWVKGGTLQAMGGTAEPKSDAAE